MMIDWSGTPTKEGLSYLSGLVELFDYSTTGAIALGNAAASIYGILDWSQDFPMFPLMSARFGVVSSGPTHRSSGPLPMFFRDGLL